MQKQRFLFCAICLTGLMVLAGCGASTAEQPDNSAATDDSTAEVVVVPDEEGTMEEDEAMSTEEPAEEIADADTKFPPVPYGAYPAEWLNRNILGDPDAPVLVEAYEEFM